MRRPRFFARLVDLRPGESRTAILGALVLMLAAGGYSALETARDALLVTRLPQREFGIVYIAVAVCSLPAAALLARAARWWDARRVLVALLLFSAAALLVYTALPIRRGEVIALYVTAGLIASTLFPQFWVLIGTSLTVGQSRRLIGPIASAGVVGSVVGASLGAATLPRVPVRGLIALAAAMLVTSAAFAFFVSRPPPRPTPESRGATTPLATSVNAMREEPFLVRVALLVAVTTATALVIDYFFKFTIARTVPSDVRGAFIARYYAVINVVALAVQLFLGSAIVRGFGVARAMVVTPLFSTVGGATALLAASFSTPVLLLKALDVSLRSSINRLTTELVYLPVSSSGRERAKPFIDGALARIVQAVTAGTLLALASVQILSARMFGGIVVFLSLLWLFAATTMQKYYLGQLRRSVVPTPAHDGSSIELDLSSAELIVEHLGSDDPTAVIAAMITLHRRGRQGLIPALVLRHPDARVIVRALEIFASGPPTRSDWHTLAGQLIEHSDEGVRIAAASILAARGKLDFDRLAADSSPKVRGYTAFHAAVVGPHDNLADDPRLVDALRDDGAALAGVLAAVADADPSPRVSRLLLTLADVGGPRPTEWTRLLARAMVGQGGLEVIPRLLERIPHWEDRETIRTALLALGQPAFDQVARVLDDANAPRSLRLQLPQTLGRFGTPAAAEKLLELVEHEADGLVRYKALRALGRLVVDYRVGVDRGRVARCVRANLVGYFDLLGVRVALGPAPNVSPGPLATAFRLFTGLVDDKVRQSVERAFRLLKIAHPKEDIHRVYLARMGTDKRARANASEFLDALLWRRDEKPLRALVRILSDDLSPEAQSSRAAMHLGLTPPGSHDEAVRAALADADIKVVALAALYALATGTDDLLASVRAAYERHPSLAPEARGLFHGAFNVPATST